MDHSTPPLPPPAHPPELHPPLTIAWRADAAAGYLDQIPVSDGEVVVVGGDRLVGLALDDGKIRWRFAPAGRMRDLTATRDGPVVAHVDGDSHWLTALDWAGRVRWRVDPGIAMAARSLRGLDTHLLAIGVHLAPRTRQVCRLIAADSGTVVAEYPYAGLNSGVDVVPRGIVCSDRAGEPARNGLWLHDIATGRDLRLHPAPHEARAVVGAIAVINTTDVDSDPTGGELLAFDTDSGEQLWSAPGGPALNLVADRRQVLSVLARDDGTIAPTLHELRSGEPAWRGEAVAGSDATLMLAADAVLVLVDGLRLMVFERSSGKLLQTLEEPSNLVYGGCLAGRGLVDVCAHEVRFLAA